MHLKHWGALFFADDTTLFYSGKKYTSSNKGGKSRA